MSLSTENVSEAAKALRNASDALEEFHALASDVEDGRAFIVYRCNTHGGEHRNGNPLMEVTHVDFDSLIRTGAKATLKCGHGIVLADGVTTGKGEFLPCVWCAEDCHS